MSYDDWIDDNEYPNDADIEKFGDDSPPDYDPLTIGYLDDSPPFWTTGRIVAVVLLLVLIAAVLTQILR